LQRHCNAGAIKNAGYPRSAIKNTHDFLEATLSIGFGVFRTKNAGAPGAIKNKGPTRATTPKMPMRRFGVSPIADFPDSSPRQAGFRRPNPAPQLRIADHSPKNYPSSWLWRFSHKTRAPLAISRTTVHPASRPKNARTRLKKPHVKVALERPNSAN
jgi:hypothetical protein